MPSSIGPAIGSRFPVEYTWAALAGWCADRLDQASEKDSNVVESRFRHIRLNVRSIGLSRRDAVRRLARINVLRRKPDVADWFYLPSWKRTTQPSSLNGDAPAPANFLIFSDRCGLGANIAQRLEEMGHAVVSVEAGAEFSKHGPGSYAINPREASDYDKLVDELVAQDQMPQRVVHLWSVTPDDESPDFESSATHGFYSLLFLLQAAGRRTAYARDRLQIDVVSNNMHEVNGDETRNSGKSNGVRTGARDVAGVSERHLPKHRR